MLLCLSLAVMATMVTRMASLAAGGSAQTQTAGMTTATKAIRLLRAASGALIGTGLLPNHRPAIGTHSIGTFGPPAIGAGIMPSVSFTTFSNWMSPAEA